MCFHESSKSNLVNQVIVIKSWLNNSNMLSLTVARLQFVLSKEMNKNLIFELILFLLHLKYKANGFSYTKIYKMRGRISLLEVIDPAYICWTHFSVFPYSGLSYRKTELCKPLLPLSSYVSLFTSEFVRYWWRLEYMRKGEIQRFLLFIQGFPGALATLPASTFCQVNQRPGIHQHGLLSLFLQHAAANSQVTYCGRLDLFIFLALNTINTKNRCCLPTQAFTDISVFQLDCLTGFSPSPLSFYSHQHL